MPTDIESANNIKLKIIEILKLKGPSLPVQIASKLEISSLFAGAFLSELAKERAIKISNMKVGGSPLYFLQGQEEILEKFYTYLPGKEKEAFLLLKEKKILQDRKQQPAIRVALRNLKDFALTFSSDNELWWHFHSVGEQQVRELFEKTSEKPKLKQAIKLTPKIKKKTLSEKPRQKIEQQLDIGLKPISKPIAKTIKKTRTTRSGQNFLEEIKPFLQNKNIQLTGLEEVSKKKIIAHATLNSQPCLLAAYNKKRITEKELIKIYKIAKNLNLPYYIITKDEPTKKMKETMAAYKNLLKIDKLE